MYVGCARTDVGLVSIIWKYKAEVSLIRRANDQFIPT